MVYGIQQPAAGWKRNGGDWLGKLQYWLLPARCIACGNDVRRGDWGLAGDAPQLLDLCLACHATLPLNRHACRRCALPLSTTQPELLCGRCLVRPPHYQASCCAYQYGYPLHHLIRRLKYHDGLSHARVLGALLGAYLRDQHTGPWPECFVPVPLHPYRFRRRGYNQVIELGKYVQREVRIEMRTDLVTRVRNTAEQAGLTRRARRSNLRRAFVVATEKLPKHIALLDDVITTGSTVNELSRVFKARGVERIEVWGLARAATGKANTQ